VSWRIGPSLVHDNVVARIKSTDSAVANADMKATLTPVTIIFNITILVFNIQKLKRYFQQNNRLEQVCGVTF
jgi:hypothetical protein